VLFLGVKHNVIAIINFPQKISEEGNEIFTKLELKLDFSNL